MEERQEGILMPLQTEAIYSLWSLLKDFKKNIFTISMTAYQILGNMLICSSNKTISGIAAVIVRTI